MRGIFETIKKYLPLIIKNQLGRVYDRLVCHCLPPKTIVLIMSSMRSGSMVRGDEGSLDGLKKALELSAEGRMEIRDRAVR